ncbi:uncharacterized protein LOC143341370 [Colletes latitarsis]|uniref:uncharacterized protein LOC143341370 n=1 Tax=Colletes latitarsis TaxID=2605962 RepID=UPI004037348F
MLFLLSRGSPRSFPVLALLATNLVISMPAPPTKRSPGDASGDGKNGFSNAPKVLEIQLPLKIATKDDLVAWAKYVMGLMASKINITLAAVKETPKASENIRNPSNVKQSRNNSGFRVAENAKQSGNTRVYATAMNMGNSRYAENVRNYGDPRNFERNMNLGTVRPAENGRQPDNARIPSRLTNFSTPKEKPIAVSNLPNTANIGLGNRQPFSTFAALGVADTTIHSPLAITANINVPRPRIKEQDFKEAFQAANSLKVGGAEHLFVPSFPDFGPVLDIKGNDIFKNFNTVSPPPRTYLPVTTIDSIKFPNDPFVTRYFFDGVERNISNNIGLQPSDIMFTTLRPLIFNEEIPLPVKSVDLTTQKNVSNPLKPLFRLPFEAVITITREDTSEPTTLKTDKDKYYAVPTRNPPDQFPPYFDTNYTITNESGQINVVFDDGSQVTESLNRNEKKKQEKKKKESSNKQPQKTEKTPKRPSTISRLIKAFLTLRKNDTLPVDLTPPPLQPQKLTTQKFTTPQRTQTYPERPSSSRHGNRNRTILAQRLEDDDDDDDSGSEKTSDEDGGDGDGNGGDDDDDNDGDKEDSSDESGSSESESSEEEEEPGGSVQAVISLLQLAAPILDDLSDPESDADIRDVLQAGLPLLEELSEGDGENPGVDIPGLLVPILLQLSAGPEGRRDSAAILTPLLQLSAPLIGPLSGPLIVPLSHQSSNPPGKGGSSIGALVKTSLGPLLEPPAPGKMPPLTNLVAGIVSSLSKNGKGKSDITSLVKAVIAGSVAGSSAGSSGGHRDTYAAPTNYGGDSYHPVSMVLSTI